MARKELVVEFSPDTGPFDTPTWIELTGGGPHGNRVRSAQWKWGRESDDQDWPPGQATIVLTNHDRLFDPDNTSGTYSGDLNPRVPFRLVTNDGEDLFYGFVEEGWEQTYAHPVDGYCTVKLVDMLTVLEGVKLPGVFEHAVTALGPVHYWTLTTPGATDLGSGRIAGTPEENPSFGAGELFPGLGDSVEFDGEKQRVDISRSPLHFDLRHCSFIVVFDTDVPAPSGSVSPLFFQGDGNTPNVDLANLYVYTDGTLRLDTVEAGTGSMVSSAGRVDDGRPHLAFAQRDTGGVGFGVGIDTAVLNDDFGIAGGQAGNGSAIGGTPFAPPGYDDNYFAGRIGHLAIFDAVLDQAQRQTVVDALPCLAGARADEQIEWALDRVGVPAGLRSLDEGRSLMGPARTAGVDALGFLRLVAATENGAIYIDHADGGKVRFVERYAPWFASRSIVAQATVSDDPTNSTAVRVEPGSLVVEPNGIRSVTNQVTVRWVDGAETAEDAASVAAYGPRGKTVATVAENSNQALSLAQWACVIHAEPATRISGFGLNPAGDDAGFPVAVDLRPFDLVTFRSQPGATGSVVTRDVLIEGISHRVDGLEWKTTFYTSATPAGLVDLFILGTSLLDGTDVLGY